MLNEQKMKLVDEWIKVEFNDCKTENGSHFIYHIAMLLFLNNYEIGKPSLTEALQKLAAYSAFVEGLEK
jgi:hypothetical protein